MGKKGRAIFTLRLIGVLLCLILFNVFILPVSATDKDLIYSVLLVPFGALFLYSYCVKKRIVDLILSLLWFALAIVYISIAFHIFGL